MKIAKAAVYPITLNTSNHNVASVPVSKRAVVSVLTNLEEIESNMQIKLLLDDSTQITSELSDNDSIDENSSTDSMSIRSIPSDSIEEESQRERKQHPRKKSVRFSSVSIREYTVIEELRALSGDLEGFLMPVRTLSWEYSQQKPQDVDSHQKGTRKEKVAANNMVIYEINRQTRETEGSAEIGLALMKSKKSKGLKGKMKKLLKEIGKSFSDVSGCSQ